MSGTAVLLIAHGSPERNEDIPEFLQNISRGRPMPEAVVREVQHRYSLIGSSPLTRITRQQAELVARELSMPTYVGMRNWHPFIADTLRQMASDNVGRAVAVCLAPHNSRTSVGLYKEVLFGAGAEFAIDFVEEWHDRPLLIQAFAEKLRAGLDLRRDATVVYGAPPLLSEKALQGETDATLTFWNFCARLEGKGMRRAIDMADLVKRMDALEARINGSE